MSDSEDIDYASDVSQDGHGRHDYDSVYSDESSGGEVGEDDSNEDESVAIPTLQFCSAHKPGQMIEVCKTCSAALSMLRPEVAKQLVAPITHTALARYSARSDEKPPTLVLPNGIVELAENIFTAGMFKSRFHWNELIQKFLTLPPEQHDRLVRDLKPEPMFKTMESEPRFKYIFQYRKELGECLKNLRISQRPIFSMIDTIDSHIPVLRGLGVSAGICFPDVAPVRDNAVPKKLPDTLASSDISKLFSLPAFSDLFAGVSSDISNDDKAMIEANLAVIMDEMQESNSSARNHYMSLYSAAANVANKVDDLLNFYCDVYSHTDACLRDLIRTKLANVFKSEFRSDLLGKNLTVEQRRNSKDKDSGLLGGGFIF